VIFQRPSFGKEAFQAIMDEITTIIEALVDEQVEILRKSLTDSLLAVNVTPADDDISMITTEFQKINDDDTSIVTEACTICLCTSEDLQPFNFKIKANCECEVMGCFKCWERYYKMHKKESTISCPKCRRDITGFLFEQGFKQLRLCTFCKLAGHMRRTCAQRKKEELETRYLISVINEDINAKKIELQQKIEQLHSLI